MKVLFLSIFIFLFFGCNNQETFEVQTSNSDEVLIIDEKTKLVRTFENDYSVLGSAENMESANKLLDAHKLINKRENTNFTIVKFETPLILKKEVANG